MANTDDHDRFEHWYRREPSAVLLSIHQCVAALRAGEIGPKDAAELIEALLGADVHIQKRKPGQRTLETNQGIKCRNAALKHVAKNFFTGRCISVQAADLAQELTRYHATAWQRDRQLAECPARYTGTPRAFLFRILKLIDAPLSARTIRRILATS